MITFRKRIWSLANMMVEFLTGIGTIVFVTRLYTTEEAGSWFLFIAIFALAGSLRDALIQPALVKDTAGKSGNHLLSILKANVTITFFFEVTATIIVILGAYFSHSTLGNLLLWFPIYSLPSAWQRWQTYYLRSKLELASIMYGGMISLLTLIVGLGIIVAFHLPLLSLMVALGTSSLAGAIYFACVIKFGRVLNVRIHRPHIKVILQFGLFGMGREATSSVSSRISLFITSAFLTLQHTAILGISQRFAQIALLPNNSFQSVLFPGLVQAVEEGDHAKARKLFHDSLSLLSAITIPVSVLGIIFSPYMLAWISGPEYRSSWQYLAIYVFIATLITPFGAAFGSAVTAWGKPQLAFRLVLVNSVINIVLSFVLIKYMGLIGAPLAMVIVEIIGLCSVSYLLNRTSGITILDTFKQIPSVYAGWFRHLLPSSNALHFNEVKKII